MFLVLTGQKGPQAIVFRPDGRSGTDATVIYLHGYGSNAETAWSKFKLRDQFTASRLNATYIIPTIANSASDPVGWSNLDDLLWTAVKITGDKGLRNRPLIVVGHSGAYRTLIPWLPSPRIKHIVLLDALYKGAYDFMKWFNARSGRRLDNIYTTQTKFESEALSPAIGAMEFIGFGPVSAKEAKQPALFFKSQYGHTQIVSDAVVIPAMLDRVATTLASGPLGKIVFVAGLVVGLELGLQLYRHFG